MNLKHFIEDNLNLIAKNDFQSLYDKLNTSFRNELTYFLYSCDIDPLNYLKYFIPNYLDEYPDVINLPSNIIKIDNEAFSNVGNITDVILTNVVSVGNRAFKDCISLVNIQLPEVLNSLEFGCFEGCKSLKTITIPKNVCHIGFGCFYRCLNLEEIHIESPTLFIDPVDLIGIPYKGMKPITIFMGCTKKDFIKSGTHLTKKYKKIKIIFKNP